MHAVLTSFSLDQPRFLASLVPPWKAMTTPSSFPPTFGIPFRATLDPRCNRLMKRIATRYASQKMERDSIRPGRSVRALRHLDTRERCRHSWAIDFPLNRRESKMQNTSKPRIVDRLELVFFYECERETDNRVFAKEPLGI